MIMIASLLFPVVWAGLPFLNYQIRRLEVHRDFSKPNLIWSQEAQESDPSGEISLIVLYRAITDSIAQQMLLEPRHSVGLAKGEVSNVRASQEAFLNILQRIQKKGSTPAIKAAATKSLEVEFKTYVELEEKLEPVLRELYQRVDPVHQPLYNKELALSLMRAKDFHLPPQRAARMSVHVELASKALQVLP